MCGEVRGQLSGVSSPSTTGVLRNGCSNCSLQMRVLRQEVPDQLAACRTELHIGMEREETLGRRMTLRRLRQGRVFGSAWATW